MTEYWWVCARDLETKEWAQCVRFKNLEDAKKFAKERVYDFLDSWVRIEDEDGNVVVEYKK